jgi:hypothetical protein
MSETLEVGIHWPMLVFEAVISCKDNELDGLAEASVMLFSQSVRMHA